MQSYFFFFGLDLTEVESRTQGSRPRPRTQKNPRPRPRTAFPRTDPLEAENRNTRGQGQRPRTQPQVFFKKSHQKSFSGYLQFIGVPRIFDWGRPNHKSHAMTSSKFFQRRSFSGTKISQDERSEIVACWHSTRILQREKA